MKILSTAFALAAISIAGAASAQTCAPRAAVLQHLSDNFGETRQSIGMAEQGRVVEVFANTDSGSWTITVTLPNGMTCLVAAGESFEVLAEDLPPAGIAG